VFCNRCGQAVSENASTCAACGTPLPHQSQSSTADDRKVRRFAIALTVLLGSIGLVWDVLAGFILFRSYTFFEGVVVCLLVMILCAIATMRADFELWSGIFQSPKSEHTDRAVDHDLLDKLRAHLKALFYGIAFLMALVKLVLVLIEGS
jgi:ribosomal protein L37E